MKVKIIGDIKKVQQKHGDKSEFIIEGDFEEVSDSYHSFNSLYAHRMLLFIALMKTNKSISWRSRLNSDGSKWDGWFVAGMRLPSGLITYHLDDKFWEMLNDIETLEKGEWDGHTSDQVLTRLNNWSFTL